MSSSNPSRSCPRATMLGDTESAAGLPSGSGAGVSTALWRANTPGVGGLPGWRPVAAYSAMRSRAMSAWLRRGVSASRWASTMAPSTAVTSRAAVSCIATTYGPNISAASP